MTYFRLKKEKDFQRVFHKGKRLFSPSLTMIYFPSNALKMGISIGKKHGKSVQRNRIKRLIREAFRLNAPMIKGNYFIVLIPKIAEEYAFDTFHKHVKWMIEKGSL
ncbi:MAG: ribonuclease P protein component [Clostridia bacterium]|nr:ribonuclease P protein component [Clostridia bacterium]